MAETRPDPQMDWRERRRLQAWLLHEQGWSQRQIADQLGVTQGAVSQWLKRAREGGGPDALRRKPAPGRQAGLNHAQLEQIPELLAQGPAAYGLQGDKWTTGRVAAVLSQVFGITYHPAHVSRLLRKHNPTWRNTE